MRIDLNCDLGEGEPPARTKQLMRLITSANIACGGHAGDVESMRRCVLLAKEFKVRLGAHPGCKTQDALGRGSVQMNAAELELLLLHQVGALERIAAAEKVRLHHIKLHGGLYHATERDPALAKAFLRIVRRWWPGRIVYALAGGTVARAAASAKVEVWPEAFLDRNYDDDGSLVPRSEPRALLSQRAEILERIGSLILRRCVTTIGGKKLRVAAATLCVHSDTPQACRIAELAARTMLTM